jgi:hypothetical protein
VPAGLTVEIAAAFAYFALAQTTAGSSGN